MNVEELLLGFECLSNFGVTLSYEKRLVIYNSLVVLRSEVHYDKIYLWGIIRGLNADYYIAYGYKKDILIKLTFYYSTNGLDWHLLPKPKGKDLRFTLLCSSRFQGDPKFTTQIDYDDPLLDELNTKAVGVGDDSIVSNWGTEMNENEDEIDLIKEEGKIKEEDRLAAVVFMIKDEAMIVPRAALYKRHDGLVVENKAFEGLTLLEGDEMRSYLHYRVPQEKWNTNILTRHEYNYGVDFLDTIDSDKPQGLWVMRFYDGNKTIFLQHLSWPGYTFCHIVECPFYFSFYYGYGKKNADIPFML